MNKTAIVTTDILEEKILSALQSVHSGMIAEIDVYSKETGKAKVIPYAKTDTAKGYKRYPAVNLPVMESLGGGFRLIPNYKKGDIVYLSPGMISTANSLKGQVEPDFTRLHSLENMVITGAFDRHPISRNPADMQDGIVIMNDAGLTFIMKENSVEISAGGNVQQTILGEDLKTFLENLIDLLISLTVTSTAPGTPSSPPLNAAALSALKAQLPNLLTSVLKVSP